MGTVTMGFLANPLQRELELKYLEGTMISDMADSSFFKVVGILGFLVAVAQLALVWVAANRFAKGGGTILTIIGGLLNIGSFPLGTALAAWTGWALWDRHKKREVLA